jgi:hypothetical protein
MNRVLAIEDSNILVLRNPAKESQIAFEKRALALAYEVAGLEVGDADHTSGTASTGDEYPSPPYEPETQDN